MQLNLPSPLQRTHLSPRVEVFVKRDDLIHPWVSGNKYRKLKGYLEGKKVDQLITYGGPFSNHLHATAAYCFDHNIPCKVFVRGLDADLDNPTLRDIQKWRAEIELLSRTEYRLRKQEFSDTIIAGNRTLSIPEGGWGEMGFVGMKELNEEIHSQMENIDVVVLPVGSATTLIGLERYLPPSVSIFGVRAVKDKSLDDRLNEHTKSSSRDVRIIKGYEWNGFARYDAALIKYMDRINRDLDLPLDFIYNAKAFYALEDLITKDQFRKGSRILYLHTGGLQGNRGLEYMASKKGS